MKKLLLLICFYCGCLVSKGQSIVNTTFSDSTLYGTHTTAGVMYFDVYKPVYKLMRRNDSVFARSGGEWVFQFKDSIGIGGGGSSNKVDTIYRTPGKDSIQFTIDGRYHAIKDSSGGGGGSGWGLTGTGSTNSGSNFVGTTDNADLVLKTNNYEMLRLDSLKHMVTLSYDGQGTPGTAEGLKLVDNIFGYNIQISAGAANTLYLGNGTSNILFGTWKNPYNGYTLTNDYQGIFTNAGTPVGVGSVPSSSAILEATSTTKGFLPPRMTATQAEAISSPAEGLMIYSTNGTGSTITSKGWWGWDGSAWVKLN